MLFSIPAMVAPTGVVITPKAKFVRIKIDTMIDPQETNYDQWFVEFVIFRYTSLANANANTNATEVGRSSETKFRDDEELTRGPFWYRVAYIDRFEQMSPLSTAVGITYRGAATDDVDDSALTDPKFDPTAPGVPTSLAVNPGNLAYDADKKVHATALLTWLAPATGRVPARYRIIQTNNTTGEVERYTTDTADLSIAVPVRSGQAYNYQVAAITKTGNRGTFTTAVTYTRPKKTVNLPAPGVLTLVSTKKRISVEWDDVDEQTYPDYDVTYIYSNTTGTVPVPGTTARWKATRSGKISRDGLVNATTYYFWIAHRDKAGNFGTLSSVVSGTSTGSEVTSFSDLSGSIAGGQIPNDIITDAKVVPSDSSNMLRNPECDDVSLWSSTATLFSNASDVYGSKNYLVASATTATVTLWSGRNAAPDIPIRKDKKYYISGYIGTFSGVTVTCQLIIQWFSMDAAGVTTMISQVAVGAYTGTSVDRVEGIFQAPPTARRARLVVFKSVSASAANTILIEPDIHLATDKELLADGAVTSVKTDPTAPVTPTGLSIGVGSIEVLDDGTVQAYANVTWSAVATGVPFTHYRIKQTQVSNSEVQFFDVPAGTLAKAVPVKTGKSYNYQIATVTFNNKEGAYSSAVAYTRPKKAGAVPAVGTVTATGLKKRIKLDWTDIDDDANPDYRITYVYKSTSATVPTLGTTTPFKKTKAGQFVDDNVTNATNYYYHVVHKDNSGNFGTISATVGPVQSGGGEVTSFSDLSGSIATAQIPAASVIPSKLTSPDPSNKVPDPNCLDIASWVSAATLTSIPIADSESSNAIDAGPATTGSLSVRTKEVAVKGDKTYRITGMLGSDDGTAFNGSIQINWYSMDAAGSLTLITNINVGSGLGSTTVMTEKTGLLKAPSNARRAAIAFYKFATVTAHKMRVQAPSLRLATDVELLADEAVTSVKTDPTAPVTPTGLSIGVGSIEVLDDGTIQAFAAVSWSAVATGVPFTHYRIKQTQVSNSEVQFFDVPAGTISKAVPVKTGKSYNYQVTTVTFNNKEGVYSSAVAYTRPKKTGSVPAVGTVTATGLKKRIKLDWTDIDDDANPDYRITYIYKNTVATVPTLGTTTPFKKTKAGQFVDDNVTNATNYYYHVVHKDNSGNFGTISATIGPVQSGGGEVTAFSDLTGSIATGQIPANTVTGAQTDQSIPSAPLSLSAGAGSIEIDDDGKKEARTSLTWSAPTTNAALVTRYRIKVTQVATGEIQFFESNTTSASIPVKTGKAYDYQVCGITFNEKEGTYTTAVSYTRPKKAGSLPAVGTVVLTPGKKRILISWPAVNDDTYPDYKVTQVYRNTVNTPPTLGTTTPYRRLKGDSVLDEGVATGQTYYYWVAHKDDAGYFSALSTVQSGTSLGNEVSGFTDLSGSIAGAQIPDDTIVAPMVAPAAIYPSNLYRPLTSNLVKDYDLIEKENLRFTEFLTSAGTGTEVPMLDPAVVRMNNPSTDLIGPSNYKFRMTAPAVSYTLRVETDRMSPVEEGLWYEFSCYLSPKVSWATIQQITMRAMWWTIDSSGNIVALSESASSTFGTLGTSPLFSKGFQAPSNAVYASLKISIQAASGQLIEHDYTSPKIRQLPLDNDYTEIRKAFTTVALTFGNTSGTSILDITGNFKKNLKPIKSIEAAVRFRNGSGAAADFSTIAVQYSIKGSGIWNSLGDDYSNVPVGNGGQFTGFYVHIPTSGALYDAIDTVDFRALVDPDQAGNDLRQRFLSVRVFYS